MQSITGSKICQCIFHSGATGVESKRPCQVIFFLSFFLHADVCSEPESSGGGKVKYAKNLHRTCLDVC